MDLCESKLLTDELQFVFKKGVGCRPNDAIFTLKTIINHFTSGRSSVFSAALDIRKAFDRVPHGKLMDTYVKCDYPVILLMSCLIGMIYCKQLCVGMGFCQGRF